MSRKTQLSLRQLDQAIRNETQHLLLTAQVYEYHAYGWLDADTADPEFIGHAMWQTNQPDDAHLEYPHFAHRRGLPPPAALPDWQKIVAVSGTDFEALMDSARTSIGLALLQATLLTEDIFGDDRIFDLHRMNATILLSTAADRIRELFIAAYFRQSEGEYKASNRGRYKTLYRKWYTTPFVEGADTAASTHKMLSSVFARLIPIADDVHIFRDSRNKVIHDVATSLGRQRRELLNERVAIVDPDLDFTFSDMERLKSTTNAAHAVAISEAMSKLTACYMLLIRLSNEVFIVEHAVRNPAAPSQPAAGRAP